jgi:ribosomal protein S27AE
MGNSFPVELPACPRCGTVFMPEELALGRILSVEKELEDK